MAGATEATTWSQPNCQKRESAASSACDFEAASRPTRH